MANGMFQKPRIVVEESPWGKFFQELPSMLLAFKGEQSKAIEAEKTRQHQEDMIYLRSMLDTKGKLQDAVLKSRQTAIEKGATLDFNLQKVFNTTPAHSTNGVQIVNQDVKKMHQEPINVLLDHLDKIGNEEQLASLGAKHAQEIDINYDSELDTAELGVFQKENPELFEQFGVGVTEFPKSYLSGARAYLDDPKVKKSRQALYDLNAMVAERVEDIDPDTPGLQWDPKDPRNADIQTALDMIQLQNIPAAAAALAKITGAEDPTARQKYTPTEQTILEAQGLDVGIDPTRGTTVTRTVERSAPYLEDETVDVSREEAAKIIMTEKDKYKLAQEMKTQVKLAEGMEEKRKDDFDAEQATRYKAAHNWFKSGPLNTSRSTTGEYRKGTPGWVKDIFKESNVLYTLLKDPSWHPTASQKHESPEAIKGYQAEIEKYITELMTKKGYDPDSELQEVFSRGTTAQQGAKNVLKSPKFQAAVDPDGDGNIDTKEAAKNLNELFDLHGVSQTAALKYIFPPLIGDPELAGIDEASEAQGEAIAHLYNIWFGLESELNERRRNEMDRIDAERKFNQIYSGQ